MCSKPYFFKKNMKKWLIKNEIPSSCIIDIHNVYSKSSITPGKKKNINYIATVPGNFEHFSIHLIPVDHG
jgi:hypothetical protein